MHQRRVMTLLGTGALVTLFFGCATQKTDAVARLTESDALRSALPNELVGPLSDSCGPPYRACDAASSIRAATSFGLET